MVLLVVEPVVELVEEPVEGLLALFAVFILVCETFTPCWAARRAATSFCFSSSSFFLLLLLPQPEDRPKAKAMERMAIILNLFISPP